MGCRLMSLEACDSLDYVPIRYLMMLLLRLVSRSVLFEHGYILLVAYTYLLIS